RESQSPVLAIRITPPLASDGSKTLPTAALNCAPFDPDPFDPEPPHAVRAVASAAATATAPMIRFLCMIRSTPHGSRRDHEVSSLRHRGRVPPVYSAHIVARRPGGPAYG